VNRNGTTGIAHAIVKGVRLVWIRHQRAVIPAIRDAVTVEIIVTDVSKTVTICIELIAIAHKRTVIPAIHDAVTVKIIITDVAQTITIRVELIGIANKRTVIATIRDAVTIAVKRFKAGGTRFVVGDIGQRAGGALAVACPSPTIKLVFGIGRGRASTAAARRNRGS
jgi:hypothetical protein